jgi:hypothetical protein
MGLSHRFIYGESSFAKGHGNINLEANTVSGVMCQQDRAGTVIMSVEHHLSYHSHYAEVAARACRGLGGRGCVFAPSLGRDGP